MPKCEGRNSINRAIAAKAAFKSIEFLDILQSELCCTSRFMVNLETRVRTLGGQKLRAQLSYLCLRANVTPAQYLASYMTAY